MKLQSKRRWPRLVILSALAISLVGCTPKPPDVPACEYLQQHIAKDPVTGHLVLTPSPTCEKKINEPECGHCVYIVSGKETFVGEAPATRLKGKPWSLLRAESVYLPAVESYAPLAAYIIDACEKMNCSSEVTKFKVKLDALNGVVPAIKNP